MLNRALRLMDAEMIVNMGFFISDLHRHIEKLHHEQFGGHRSNKSFIVYRGQGLSKVDFEQLSKTKGGLLSFNNFLSTSKKQEVSIGFVRRCADQCRDGGCSVRDDHRSNSIQHTLRVDYGCELL